MADYKLTQTPPLDEFSGSFDGVEITQVTGRAIISIALPTDKLPTLKKRVATTFKIRLPEVGLYTHTSYANGQFICLQENQYFIIFDEPRDDPLNTIAKKLKFKASLSDQSDSYLLLNITGPKAATALERICPIDLHPDEFPTGKIARTRMDHMAVVVMAEKNDTYLLISPRSSATSFLHAVETSIRNVS